MRVLDNRDGLLDFRHEGNRRADGNDERPSAQRDARHDGPSNEPERSATCAKRHDRRPYPVDPDQRRSRVELNPNSPE
jgi:hypothetical protein